MAVQLYRGGSGYYTAVCSNCGKYHELAGLGLDGSQSPPTPVYTCMYGAGGGGTPVIVAAIAPSGPVDQLPAGLAAAIESGAIVR